MSDTLVDSPAVTTAPAKASGGPLTGVRILDLTSVVMGPWATQNLADLGADVICVEAAGGDPVRFLGGGKHPLLCGVAINVLRNKRNIALDLKNPAGREAFLKIAATCDIVITNLRPAPRKRLGLTYEDVKAVKPDIIYCHAQGWSIESGRGDEPAYDDVIQASGGMAALFAMQNGKPSIAPVAMADQIASLTIDYVVLAALFHRERTGEGQSIEVPMTDVMANFAMVMHGKDAILEPPIGPAGYQRLTSPLRSPLPTKDGHLQIVLYTKDNWAEFFIAGGMKDAHSDPRLQTPIARNDNYADLYAQMAEILTTKTTAEWIAWCHAYGIPNSPVVSLEELIEGYEIAEHPIGGKYRRLPLAANFSRTPGGVRREAPLPGEHNDEILTEAGYSSEEIARIKTDGGVITGALKPK